MVDTDTGLLLNRWFGAKGNPGSGHRNHLQIIGTIANGNRIICRNAVLGSQHFQGINLGLAVQHRLLHLAGQGIIRMGQQDIGLVKIKAQFATHGGCEKVKPARYQSGEGPVGPHGGHQFAGATGIFNPFPGFIKHRGCHPREQPDPFIKGRFKVQFAIHGARGNGGNAVFDSGKIGKFVKRFARHHRAVHIGNQQLFGSPGNRLHHLVGINITFFQCLIGMLKRYTIKDNLTGFILRKPAKVTDICPGLCERGGCRLNHVTGQSTRVWRGDQGQHQIHLIQAPYWLCLRVVSAFILIAHCKDKKSFGKTGTSPE